MARVLNVNPKEAGVPSDLHVIALPTHIDERTLVRMGVTETVVDDGIYWCTSAKVDGDGVATVCGFRGELGDAIEHAVTNQFQAR